MGWLHRRTNTPIGIDLDGRTIRAVQLSGSPQGWCLQAIATLRRQQSNVPVSPEEIAALVRMFPQNGFTGNEVVLALPADKLISAILDLPPCSSGAPVEQIARAELARMHECDPRVIEMASWALPQPTRAGKSTPTMVCACTYSDAEGLIKLLERCGQHVVAIDTRSRALARACTPVLIDPNAITAIVELGWDWAYVVAMHGALVAYDRALSEAGLEKLVEALLAKSSLDRPAADALLREVTLNPENANRERSKRARKPATRVEMHFDMVGDELSAPLSYLANQYPDTPVREVVLTGPCATIQGLAEYMAARLGIDVRVITPQHLVDVPETLSEPVDSGAIVATGLAQYGPDKAAPSVNLIPSPNLLNIQRRARTRCWIAACLAYIVMLGGVYLGCRLRWERNDLQAGEMARISADIERYNGRKIAVRGAIAALRAKIEANNAVGQQPDWSILLALVARNLGSDVVLKHCELASARDDAPPRGEGSSNRREQFVFEITGFGRTQSAVSAFVLRLEKAGLFDKVKLIKTRRQNFMSGKAVEFQLACTLGTHGRRPR